MMQAEAEAQRALTRMADTRAECKEQHKVMTAELEAMQNSVKSSLRAATQQNTVQAAKVDVMGFRLKEMKDPFLQGVLRMEVQMTDLNYQMHSLSTAPCAVQKMVSKPRTLNPPHPAAKWCLCEPHTHQ